MCMECQTGASTCHTTAILSHPIRPTLWAISISPAHLGLVLESLRGLQSQSSPPSIPAPDSAQESQTTEACESPSTSDEREHWLSDLEIEALDRLAHLPWNNDPEDRDWFTIHNLRTQPIIFEDEARFMAAASPKNIRALIHQLRNAEALLARATRESKG